MRRPGLSCLALLVIACSLGTAVHASAQIYAWRDSRGQLVLSNDGSRAVATYGVAATSEIRTTRRLPRSTRASAYDALIEEHAGNQGLSPDLVRAVIQVESAFNPRAVSPKGAMGLMQLMPATASSLDVQDSFDTRENIEGGVRHLRVLMDRYRNDLPVVLAAYNAGDTAVLNYRGVPPYRETRQYVIRVLRRYDRDAAQAAAIRIYGAGSRPAKPGQPPLKTRLMSYSLPEPGALVVGSYPESSAGASAMSMSASVPSPDRAPKERWVPVIGKGTSKHGKESP